MVDVAAERGFASMPLTGPAPVWASGNRKLRGGVRPNARYAGEFAGIVEALQGRIDRYSIWNEPNWRTWLQPLKAARGSIATSIRADTPRSSADRRAKVLIGETRPYQRLGMSTAPIAFLRSVACVNARYRRARRCAPLKADGYAHHPLRVSAVPRYRYPGADNATIGTPTSRGRSTGSRRAGALRYTGGGRMPVYLTEFGTSSPAIALPAKTRSRYLQQGSTSRSRTARQEPAAVPAGVAPGSNRPSSTPR